MEGRDGSPEPRRRHLIVVAGEGRDPFVENGQPVSDASGKADMRVFRAKMGHEVEPCRSRASFKLARNTHLTNDLWAGR